MMLTARRCSTSIAVLIGAATPTLAATLVVDVSVPADASMDTFAIGGGYHQTVYQSFTVGVDGQLAELRLPIGCGSGVVVVDIYPADSSSGLPVTGARRLLRRVYPANFFPNVVDGTLTTLPLGSRVSVTAGDVLVFTLSNQGTGECGVARSMLPAGPSGSIDYYPDGTGHALDDVNRAYSPDPVPLNLSGIDDIGFETVVSVPGP